MLQHSFCKQLEVVGSTADIPFEFRQVMKHAFAGDLKPVIDDTFSLEKVAVVHERLAERDVVGKLIVTP